MIGIPGRMTFVVLAAGMLFAASGIAAETAPFKVTVTASTNRIQLKKPFSLHVKVQNASSTTQEFEILGCRWFLNWTMESQSVQFPSWDCDYYPRVKIRLAPGKSWENDTTMTVGSGNSTNRIAFRAGFSPEPVLPNQRGGPPKYYWGNHVTLEIQR